MNSLEQKHFDAISTNLLKGLRFTHVAAKSCADISIEFANEERKKFAAGFAEWMSGLIESNYKSNGNWFVKSENKVMTTDELIDKYIQYIQSLK